MPSVDWGLVKLQYEVFGESIPALCEEYHLSESVLKYAAEDGGWRRLPVAQAVQNWCDLDKLEDVGEELIEEVQHRMRIMRTIKQAVLSPRYIALETALLGKALEVLQTIHADSPNAPAQIKTLTDVLTSLKEQNNLMPSKSAGDGQPQGMTVKIMSVAGEGANQTRTATEVSIARPSLPEPAC